MNLTPGTYFYSTYICSSTHSYGLLEGPYVYLTQNKTFKAGPQMSWHIRLVGRQNWTAVAPTAPCRNGSKEQKWRGIFPAGRAWRSILLGLLFKEREVAWNKNLYGCLGFSVLPAVTLPKSMISRITTFMINIISTQESISEQKPDQPQRDNIHITMESTDNEIFLITQKQSGS